MGLATATGLSEVLDHNVSHDKVSRFLLNYDGSSKQLWLKVNPYKRILDQVA
jgi:hypothetical protein